MHIETRAFRPNIHQFHGIIGSKNNDYADIYRARFFDPEDFVAKWLQGLVQRAKADEAAAIQKYGEIRYRSAALRMVDLMKDAQIREYTLLFLKRNFYRQLAARVRNKPDERLWSLWFGNNQLTWGLLIAGSYWQNEWRSRAHKVRHADYTYWSIGHVLEEGLVVPGDPQRLKFGSSRI
ncbi:MAG: hypothetical protein LC667_14195 [Thioalkalivibrio sp.]|nr:hypothetical protein [Thioalkalivibrio sp.]